MSKDASWRSLGDCSGCSTGTGGEGSSCGDFVTLADFSAAWESLGLAATSSPPEENEDLQATAAKADRQFGLAPLDSAASGSKAHQDGTCKPCKYFARREGCRLGDGCGYCHGAHRPDFFVQKWHPSKKRRRAIKDICSQMVVVLPAADGCGVPRLEFGDLPSWFSRNPFVRQRLVQKIINQAMEPQFGVVYRL